MKRIVLVVVFISSFVDLFSQGKFPNEQFIGSVNTENYSLGANGAGIGFHWRKSYADTIAANAAPFIKFIPGFEILVGDSKYLRSQDIQQWKASGTSSTGTVTFVGSLSPLFSTTNATTTPTFSLISQTANKFFASPNGSSGVGSFRSIVVADLPAGIGNNIYNSDDTLTGDRTVNGGTNSLTFNIPNNEFTVNSSGGGTTTWFQNGGVIEGYSNGSNFHLGSDYIRLTPNAGILRIDSLQTFSNISDSIMVWAAGGINIGKVGIRPISSLYPTFQQTLDKGSELDKDDEILGNQHILSFTDFDAIYLDASGTILRDNAGNTLAGFNKDSIVFQPPAGFFRIDTLNGQYNASDSMLVWAKSGPNAGKVGIRPIPTSSGGTITSIATGLGLSGGPITSSGTLLVDTSSASILSRQRAAATYQTIITNPVTGTSTANYLAYWNGANTITGIAPQQNKNLRWNGSNYTWVDTLTSFTGFVDTSSFATPSLFRWYNNLQTNTRLYTAKSSDSLSIIVLGNSITEMGRFTDPMRLLFGNRYNMKATGYISSYLPGGIGGITSYSPTLLTGTGWVFNTTSTRGINGYELNANSGATKFTIQNIAATPNLGDNFFTQLKIFYRQFSGGGTFDILNASNSVIGTVNTNGSDSMMTYTLNSLTPIGANQSFQISLNTLGSGIAIYGFLLDNPAVPGVILHKVGHTGYRIIDYLNIDSSYFSQQLAALKGNMVMVELGTNEMQNNVDSSTFRTNMIRLTNRIKLALPNADIMLIGQNNQNPTFVNPSGRQIQYFNDALRKVSVQKNYSYYEPSLILGSYANMIAQGNISNVDGIHPTVQGGNVMVYNMLGQMPAYLQNDNFRLGDGRYLPLTGGTLTGALNVTGTTTITGNLYASANSGIGTTNPNNRFVVSNGSNNGIEFDPVTSSTYVQMFAYNRGTSTPSNLQLSFGNFGVGTTSGTISAKLHVISTTEQQRIGYDASNYTNTTVGSTGATVHNVVGAGGAYDFRIAGTSALTVINSGNVGMGTISPNSTLSVTGSLSTTYTATATSLTANATHQVIGITATGQTITLPTAVGIQGRRYTVKLTASGTGTVGTTSSQTIDGSTTYILSGQYKYVEVISDNSNWQVIANN